MGSLKTFVRVDDADSVININSCANNQLFNELPLLRSTTGPLGSWKEKTIWDAFLDTSSRCSNSSYICTDDNVVLTYKETQECAIHTAVSLKNIGVSSGMRVAIRCSDTLDYIILSLALYSLGALKISLSNGMAIPELAYKLSVSGAEVLIEDSSLFESQDNYKDFNGTVVVVNWHYADQCKYAVRWELALRFPVFVSNMPLMKNKTLDTSSFAPLPNEISDIFFTSGSSGYPKAVGLSHDMMLRSAWSNCLNRGFSRDYRLCIPLPFSHVYAYIEGFLSVMLVGGTILVPSGKIKAKDLVSFMALFQANDVLLVPNLAINILEHLENNATDLSSLKKAYCSASSCPDWLWSRMKNELGLDSITTGYGMTEVCGASFQTQQGDSEEIISHTVGKLLDAGAAGSEELGGHTIEYKVVDPETGENLSGDQVGELCCRGITVFKGYIGNETATSDSFDENGWFHTGDLGHIDSRGYLWLEGRMSDSYKINGENVSPRFIEKIINDCCIVSRACIVGVPEARYGEVGVAFVELKHDSMANRLKVRDYCNAELAKYQVPKYFLFVHGDFWPCGETGKTDRCKLRQLAINHLNKKD